MNPTLSVIIPVYKVEAYLERCVNSVLNQDYRDLEVILVDDGSPDRCPQICDDFAAKDSRVSVIHKPNGGLSSARNAGIDKAKGKYIAFLDSDDQWAEGKLKQLMEDVVQSNVDMVMFHGLSVYPDGTIMTRDYSNAQRGRCYIYDTEELYRILIKGGDLREQAGTHIVLASFVKDNNLYFTPNLLGEDTEWMFRVLRLIKRIAVVDVALMLYSEQRPGSITNTKSANSLRDLIRVIQISIDYYKKDPENDVKPFELAQCSYLWTIALGYYSKIKGPEKKEYKNTLKSQLQYLKLNVHPKGKIVGKVYKFLGFKLTSELLGIYMNFHGRNLINSKRKVNG